MGIYSDVLLTVDYDRTLTAPNSTVPKRNIEAIQYFMANGGSFTVNTGRSVPMVVDTLAKVVPVNAPLLLYNGSAAYDVRTGRLTRYAPLELDSAAFCRDLQENFPQLSVEVQGVDAHYLFCKNPAWESYCDNCHCAWDYTAPDTIPQPLIKVSLYGEFRKNTVADMYNATPAEMELFARATAYVKSKYGEKLEVFRPCARILDMHAKGVSKLNAAKTLQKELGKRMLVCVGDAENDVAMLDGADHAYCPSDGIVAGRYENVCPCGNGAIADVIYEKIPNIL